jgi:hypothetical protein
MNRLEKMALGRRAAYLRRCIQVIELVEKHETPLTVRCRVFEAHIKPVMNCSYVTFNNMLNEKNPRKELESIENKIANDKLR